MHDGWWCSRRCVLPRLPRLDSVPFLYELRVLLDWTCTRTTLYLNEVRWFWVTTVSDPMRVLRNAHVVLLCLLLSLCVCLWATVDEV